MNDKDTVREQYEFQVILPLIRDVKLKSDPYED